MLDTKFFEPDDSTSVGVSHRHTSKTQHMEDLLSHGLKLMEDPNPNSNPNPIPNRISLAMA